MSNAVKKGDKVKVEYTLKLNNGDVVDSSKGREPLMFEVGKNQVIKGFEEGIIGMKENESKSIKVKPKDGYGDKNKKLIQEVAIKPFRESQKIEPKINMILTLRSKGGNTVPARVVAINKTDDKMVLDMNHILAGQDLNFDVNVVSIEKA